MGAYVSKPQGTVPATELQALRWRLQRFAWYHSRPMVLGVVGCHGSGKTMLVNVIARLLLGNPTLVLGPGPGAPHIDGVLPPEGTVALIPYECFEIEGKPVLILLDCRGYPAGGAADHTLNVSQFLHAIYEGRIPWNNTFPFADWAGRARATPVTQPLDGVIGVVNLTNRAEWVAGERPIPSLEGFIRFLDPRPPLGIIMTHIPDLPVPPTTYVDMPDDGWPNNLATFIRAQQKVYARINLSFALVNPPRPYPIVPGCPFGTALDTYLMFQRAAHPTRAESVELFERNLVTVLLHLVESIGI